MTLLAARQENDHQPPSSGALDLDQRQSGGTAAQIGTSTWLGIVRAHPAARPKARTRALVRLVDLTLAVGASIIAIPLMLIVALAIRVTSQGPVLFRQVRIARDGQSFTCLKFRSMYADAEVRLDRLLLDPVLAEEWLASQKLSLDPRITPLGRLLRRTNLDELPQIINVVRGEMSLVGPRPVVEHEAERYGPELRQVLSVKPGMTGLWQVSGRSNLSYDQRIDLDVSYVERRSLLSDLNIMIRTIGVLFSKNHGAT